jgi:hypothetical protein
MNLAELPNDQLGTPVNLLSGLCLMTVQLVYNDQRYNNYHGVDFEDITPINLVEELVV